MYVAYFRELGERLRPVALILLKQIQEGTDKTRRIGVTNCWLALQRSLIAQLSAALASDNLATREHAAGVLGYMGSAAFPAQARLQAAIDKAPTEREKRLLEWALRETQPTSDVLTVAKLCPQKARTLAPGV